MEVGLVDCVGLELPALAEGLGLQLGRAGEMEARAEGVGGGPCVLLTLGLAVPVGLPEPWMMVGVEEVEGLAVGEALSLGERDSLGEGEREMLVVEDRVTRPADCVPGAEAVGVCVPAALSVMACTLGVGVMEGQGDTVGEAEALSCALSVRLVEGHRDTLGLPEGVRVGMGEGVAVTVALSNPGVPVVVGLTAAGVPVGPSCVPVLLSDTRALETDTEGEGAGLLLGLAALEGVREPLGVVDTVVLGRGVKEASMGEAEGLQGSGSTHLRAGIGRGWGRADCLLAASTFPPCLLARGCLALFLSWLFLILSWSLPKSFPLC